MNIKDIDMRLSDEEKERLNKIVEHIKTKGNFSEIYQDEEKLRKKLSLFSSVCPCDICNKSRDRKLVESFSYAQVIVLKDDGFSDDNLTYIIAPFRHMSNEEFIASPLWMMVSKLFPTIKAILDFMYKDINGFHVIIDNTYGDEWREHGCVKVKFLRKGK
jgi:hypothetical protein